MADIITIPSDAIVFDIDIDIHKPIDRPTIYSMQYDTRAKYIRATIWNNSGVYPVTASDIITFDCTKPDGYGVDNECGIDANGNIIYEITEQTTAKDGRFEAEFRIYSTSTVEGVTISKRKATPKFNMWVEKSALPDGTIISTPEFNTLTNLINSVGDLQNDVNEAINRANTTINNANSISEQLTKETLIIWKPYVSTYTDIATIYSTPELGWTTQAQDTGIRWRYNGTEWTNIGLFTDDKVGDTSQLNTTNKTNTVSAINESILSLAVRPESFGAKADGTTDDTIAIQSAIDFAYQNGTNVVRLTSGKTYIITSSIVVKSKMKLICIGGKATITSTISLSYGFVNGTEELSDILFENIRFTGGCIDTDQYPRLATTVINPSLNLAIHLYGNLLDSVYPVINNVKIINCEFLNMEKQPLALCGISGKTEFYNNYMYNNFDAGFTDCESLYVVGNYSVKSRDNGFSISRGNKCVVCNGNIIKLAAIMGIFIAGWETTFTNKTGPEYFSCVGNVIRECGNSGISLKLAPKTGVVANNTIDTVYKGTIDSPNEFIGFGLLVSGYSENGVITSYAENLKISNNIFKNCYRGGIKYNSVNGLFINDNVFINIGQLTKLDGTTILSTDKTINIGIYNDETDLTRVNNVVCQNNIIIDNRETPATNYPILSGSLRNSSFINNQSFGTRQTVVSGYTNVSANNNFFDTFKKSVLAVASGDNATAYMGADLQDYLRLALLKVSGSTPFVAIGSATPYSIRRSSTPNISDSGATFTELFKVDVNGNVTFLFLGGYYLWFDSTNSVLRYKTSVPSNLTDGTIIGKGYTTSIASIPLYVGQEALVGGIWYKAIGTTSTSDWKAIT